MLRSIRRWINVEGEEGGTNRRARAIEFGIELTRKGRRIDVRCQFGAHVNATMLERVFFFGGGGAAAEEDGSTLAAAVFCPADGPSSSSPSAIGLSLSMSPPSGTSAESEASPLRARASRIRWRWEKWMMVRMAW
jgi:hypothetical protein